MEWINKKNFRFNILKFKVNKKLIKTENFKFFFLFTFYLEKKPLFYSILFY